MAVYDTWLENSIVSTDGRNGRNKINISKRQYLQRYGEIRSDLIELTEKKNQRCKMMVCGPRRIATCTLKTLKEKLLEKNIGVSIGTVLSLRPFFITFATEKEMVLCLYKICLNARLLFEPLMCQAKKDKNITTESITEFFMFNCQCLKSESGYFQWKCVTGKCHECKSLKPMSLDLSSSNHLVKFYQFEITETPCTKTTSDRKTQQKISRKCERVSREIPYKMPIQNFYQ